MTIKIDTGIPLPEPRGRIAKYPWREMQPGDSFFVPGKAPSSFGGSKNGACKSIPGSKWTCRAVTENGIKGVRVWRVS